MPGTTSAVRIAVLLSPSSSLALASLTKEIFGRANRLLERTHYRVDFVSSGRAGGLELSGVSVRTSRLQRAHDYLLVTPLDSVTREYAPAIGDVNLVRRAHVQGTKIATACLGVLALAQAGLLDDREATTHWAWASIVRDRFPAVRWDLQRMLCDHGDVITAGGYLAVVDLVLHIVAKTSSQELSHRLGQALLADSVRQKQSVYAQQLIDPNVAQGPIRDAARWIETHLTSPLPASLLARRCGLSLRSFHRKFQEAYGTTPRKYVQLKRVEKAQELLRTTRRSVEQVLQAVGVSDVASFRRVFQRELGYSPAEYRRRLQVSRSAA